MLRPAGDGEEEPWRAVGLGVSSQRAMPERRKRNPGPPVESNNLVTASIGPIALPRPAAVVVEAAGEGFFFLFYI